MAVSLATGIVFASVIILFLVPALVMIRHNLGQKVKRLFGANPRQWRSNDLAERVEQRRVRTAVIATIKP